MAKTTCKCKKVECEECPEWIFTFADLVMLMMGFFVILWVIKPSPTKNIAVAASAAEEDNLIKFEAAARIAFGYAPGVSSDDPVDRFIKSHDMSHVMLSGPHDGGQTEHQKGVQGNEPAVQNIRPSNHATEGGKMLFEVQSSTLNAETKEALDEMAKSVKGHMNIVLIKGHTALDDFPETATPQQKMELSITRAQAAMDYLISQGVEPRILRIQGCSTFEPLTQHQYGADSQDENRRIEVEVTGTLADDVTNKPTSRPEDDVPQ